MDNGTPDHLVPQADVPVSSVRHYQTAHLTRVVPSGGDRGELEHQLPLLRRVDVHAGQPAEGVLLTHEQSWHFSGTALGKLVNTVCLAPGEVTQVAMQHQSRHVAENSVDHGLQVEDLTTASTSRSAVDERDIASAGEEQSGSASAFSTSTSASVGTSGVLSLWAGQASTATTATHAHTANRSVGHRDVAEEANQSVQQAARERARLARHRQSASVREVAESEGVELTTRVVANYNHMHALTVQYYEVEQVYRLETKVTDAERLLFLPMRVIDFGDPQQAAEAVARYRNELVAATAELGLDDVSARLDVGRLDAATTSARRGELVRLQRDNLEALNGTAWRRAAHADVEPAPTHVVVLRWEGTEALAVRKRVKEITELGLKEAKALATQPPSDIASFATAEEAQVVADELRALGAVVDVERRGHEEVVGVLPEQKLAQKHLATARTDLAEARARLRRLRDRNRAGHDGEEGTPSDMAAREDAQREVQTRAAAVRTAERRVVDLAAAFERLAAGNRRLRDLERRLAAAERLDDASFHAQMAARNLEINQGLWLRLDPSVTAGLIEGRTHRGEPLTGLVDPSPVSVHGHLVGFRWRHAEAADEQAFVDEHVGVSDVEHSIAVPTGGLFAEAVLGSSNAAEPVDLTRFWNWADALPPVRPTTIAPLEVEDDQQPLESVKADGVPGSHVQLGPIAFPQLASRTEAVGQVLGDQELFRDMSGRETAAALAQHAATLTSKGAIEAGKKANENFRRFLQFQRAAGSAVLDALQRPAVDPTMAGGALNAKDAHALGNGLGGRTRSAGGDDDPADGDGELEVTFILDDVEEGGGTPPDDEDPVPAGGNDDEGGQP